MRNENEEWFYITCNVKPADLVSNKAATLTFLDFFERYE